MFLKHSARFFPKKMIKEKLKLQNDICPKCSKTIKERHEYEGDHIKKFKIPGGPYISHENDFVSRN